jgi:hypothetical protein
MQYWGYSHVKKSGGLVAITKELFGTKTWWSRNGRLTIVAAGPLFFFEEYGSILLVGELLMPLIRLLSISREKLAFLTDATAGPVSSINPFIRLVGYEVHMMYQQDSACGTEKKEMVVLSSLLNRMQD